MFQTTFGRWNRAGPTKIEQFFRSTTKLYCVVHNRAKTIIICIKLYLSFYTPASSCGFTRYVLIIQLSIFVYSEVWRLYYKLIRLWPHCGSYLTYHIMQPYLKSLSPLFFHCIVACFFSDMYSVKHQGFLVHYPRLNNHYPKFYH